MKKDRKSEVIFSWVMRKEDLIESFLDAGFSEEQIEMFLKMDKDELEESIGSLIFSSVEGWFGDFLLIEEEKFKVK